MRIFDVLTMAFAVSGLGIALIGLITFYRGGDDFPFRLVGLLFATIAVGSLLGDIVGRALAKARGEEA